MIELGNGDKFVMDFGFKVPSRDCYRLTSANKILSSKPIRV